MSFRGSASERFYAQSGVPVHEEDDRGDDDFARLVKLADVLQSPASIKKALADLAAATKAHAQAADIAERTQRQTAAELERAHREHRDTIERETAAHAKVIASERAASDKDRAEAARLRQAAEVDAKAANDLREHWSRKLQAFESAS